MRCACKDRLALIEADLQYLKSQLAALDKFTGMTSFAKHIKAAQEEIHKAGGA